MRALVVDDSRTTRTILGRILRDLGFHVAEATHGREALAWIAHEGEPDVVLVDWHMPEMDGLDFIRAIRATPGRERLPLVMVSVETEVPRIKQALDAGANEYVMKPFTKETIQEKLQLLGMETS